MNQRSTRVGLVGIVLAVAACAAGERPTRDSVSVDSAPDGGGGTVCYRAESSVMGRRTPLAGQASVTPGWIRIARVGRSDSGDAVITDADGASMPAAWSHVGSDSFRIRAADDFLTVVLALRRVDDSLSGTGLATSDAELVRDSTGALRELRREWTVTARAVACDSMPSATPRAR